MPTDTSATVGHWDRFRQIFVLVLSLAPPVTTVLAFATGTTFEEATRSDGGKPLIEPAGYAFIVWTLIYGGSVAYGIFQALPSQAGNELFRRIGFFTASAFVGTSVWLLMARVGWIWLTVVCIVWMLAALAPVFVRFVSCEGALSAAERCVVVFPLSVFTAWVTVATFANSAAAVKDSGWADVGLSEQEWTVLMLAAGGVGRLRSKGLHGLTSSSPKPAANHPRAQPAAPFVSRPPVRFSPRAGQGNELVHPKHPNTKDLGKFVSLTPRTPPGNPPERQPRRCPWGRPLGASKNGSVRQCGERFRKRKALAARRRTRSSRAQKTSLEIFHSEVEATHGRAGQRSWPLFVELAARGVRHFHNASGAPPWPP
jgi:hypothetical protein